MSKINNYWISEENVYNIIINPNLHSFHFAFKGRIYIWWDRKKIDWKSTELTVKKTHTTLDIYWKDA